MSNEEVKSEAVSQAAKPEETKTEQTTTQPQQQDIIDLSSVRTELKKYIDIQISEAIRSLNSADEIEEVKKETEKSKIW